VIDAFALQAPNNGNVLPIVQITALSYSAPASRALGNRAAAALAQYVDAQQKANGVPPAERIQLRVLNRAAQTSLVTPRSKTLPIGIFVVVLFATIGLAFVLENLRPRPNRPVLTEAEVRAAPDRVQQAS
jgi:capsular polysaccharide biosynthesis protein